MMFMMAKRIRLRYKSDGTTILWLAQKPACVAFPFVGLALHLLRHCEFNFSTTCNCTGRRYRQI